MTYTAGDVNHVLQPIVGMWRYRLAQGEQVTKEQVERAIEAMLAACASEHAWLDASSK